MNKEYKKLCPFKFWVLQNFPFIEEDFDSLTNYELMCKLSAEINKIIKSVNGIGESQEQLYNEFDSLKSYVDNYFDNLDVQDEINNKLDDMAESGELTDIIAQYLELSSLLCYNTKSDLKGADNLIEGSFTKTFGNISYNDGLGNLYKIRELINTDVVDDDNLVALTNYPTLVAEKIPNAYINNLQEEVETLNKKQDYYNLTLQPNLIYDNSDNKNIQGACITDGGLIYAYNEIASSYPYGELIVLNNNTKSYINRIQNLKLYHGNDLAYNNGKIYGASCKGETTLLKSKLLTIYDIANDSLTEAEPFSDLTGYTSLIGVAKIDTNHLLCALTKGTESVSDLIFAILDLSDMSYQTLSITNPNNLNVNYYSVFQSIEYQENKIYLVTSHTNSIMEFNIIENNAELSYIYNLPNRDVLGLITGEFESISRIPNSDSFIINSQVGVNSAGGNLAFQSYCINFKTNLPTLQKPRWENESSNERTITYLNNSSSSLYEDGSQDFPFKDLTRAINHVNYCKLYNLYIIRITGGDNYRLGNQSRMNFALDSYNVNNDINIVGSSRIEGCKIFMGIDNQKLIFKGSMIIDNSNVDIYRGTFEEALSIYNNAFARFHTCISTYNGRISLSGAQMYAGFSSYNSNVDYYIQASNFSFLMFPDTSVARAKVLDSGSNVILAPYNNLT